MEEEDNLVPVNPIEEKDRQIAALEKKVEAFKTKDADMNMLKEELVKIAAELKMSRNENKTSLKKLNFTKKATEDRLLDSISSTDGFYADPVVIGVYSATLDEDEFDFGEKTDGAKTDVDRRSRKDDFLKSIEDRIDPQNSEQKARFMEIKNQVLEKVKTTHSSRLRSRSGSSVASRGSKRDRSSESHLKDSGKSPVRARTSGIPMKT